MYNNGTFVKLFFQKINILEKVIETFKNKVNFITVKKRLLIGCYLNKKIHFDLFSSFDE